MGESAGGGSVFHQITAFGGSEQAPFQQAILQSPGWQPNSNPGFQESLVDYTIGNASLLTGKAINSVEDLRSLSFEEMALVNSAIIGRSPYGTYTFGPVVDGSFTPEMPGKLIAQGLFATSLKGLLMGTNFNEGVLFDSPFIDTDEAYRENVHLFFRDFDDQVVDYVAKSMYPDDLSGKYNYTTQALRAALTTAEGCFLCNTRYLANALRKLGNENVFKYLFAVPPAIHADDLSYTFYNGKGTLTWEGYTVEESIAHTLQDKIVNFVITGKPDQQDANKRIPNYGSDALVLTLGGPQNEQVFVDPQSDGRCDWWLQAL